MSPKTHIKVKLLRKSITHGKEAVGTRIVIILFDWEIERKWKIKKNKAKKKFLSNSIWTQRSIFSCFMTHKELYGLRMTKNKWLSVIVQFESNYFLVGREVVFYSCPQRISAEGGRSDEEFWHLSGCPEKYMDSFTLLSDFHASVQVLIQVCTISVQVSLFFYLKLLVC